MFSNMSACMLVFANKCVFTHTHVHTQTNTHTHTHTYINTFKNVYKIIMIYTCMLSFTSSVHPQSMHMSLVTISSAIAVVVMLIVCHCYCSSAQCTPSPPIGMIIPPLLTNPAYLFNESRQFLDCYFVIINYNCYGLAVA